MPRLVLLAVLIIASVAAAFYTWRTRDALEGFDDEEAKAVIADGGSNYDKRIYIMKIFDVLLRRKATAAELEQYSKKDSDTDILSAVVAKYKVVTGTPSSEKYTDTAPGSDKVKDDDTASVTAGTAAAAADSDAEVKDNKKIVKTASKTEIQKKDDDRVCLNKHDLLQNLNDITDRVSRFQSLVNSL